MEADKLIRVIKILEHNKKPIIRKILGKKLIVLPRVFDPIFFDSQILASSMKKLDGQFENVLDLGTGSGIQALFIASKSKNITAVDINPFALHNAYLNFELHKLNNKTKLIKSDLFSNINEKYDLIIFNPPFFTRKPKSLLEKAITSYDNNLLKKFFREVDKYLKLNGKILLVFSDIGNVKLLNELIQERGLSFRIFKKGRFDNDLYLVYLIYKKIL